MKRMIDNELHKWKNSTQRKALLLRGARQVGKTFAVRQLGKTYKDYYEVNFEKRKDLLSIFDPNLEPRRILRELSIDRGSTIEPGKTLLFLDEIQMCPQAILALRYFYEEMPELHIIGAGSLLEFAIEQVGMPVGRVQSITLYPVSFAEYLVARGERLLLEAICERKNSQITHNKAISLLSEYFAIGGLPEVIDNWITHDQPMKTRDTLATLIMSYRQDFEKYAKKHQLKYLNLLLQYIPLRMGGKFKFEGIGDSRKRELSPCLELMEKAHIVHKIYHSSGQGIPIGAEANLEQYKVILFDIAVAQQLLSMDLKGWFLNPQTEFVNQGELVECFVGQEIMAYASPEQRNQLYYWHREARSSEAEIDYLSCLQGNIIPIEVKAGKGSTLKSLHSFLSSHPKSPYGIKLSIEPWNKFDRIVSIPLYSAFEVVEGGVERVKYLLE